MALTKSELNVKYFFEWIGFQVEPIPQTPPQRRADFRLKDDDDSYVIEVKSKDEDEEFAAQLNSGKVAVRKEYLGRTNTISEQIRDGVDQIRKTPKLDNEFNLLVLVAAEDEAESQVEQFEGTLYGISKILCDKDGKTIAVPCYYFTFNEFFNLPDIEAAIVFWENKLKICINSFSVRGNQFRQTKLFKFFSDRKAVQDPVEIEKMGFAFIADCSLDRRKEKLIQQFIKQKYKLPGQIISLNFTHHSAAMRVPDEERGT